MSHPVTDTILGAATRGYPAPEGEVVVIRVALVLGTNHDVACYAGAFPTFEWVAMNGEKLSLTEAEIYFPSLRSELHARGLTYRGPR